MMVSSLSFLYGQKDNTKLKSNLNQVEESKNSIQSLKSILKVNNDSLGRSKLPEIEKYLKISIFNDSTFIDTTLSIKKHYKFNFLRKDDFELLKFSNIGQTYNKLTHDLNDLSFLPEFSFYANKHAYLSSSDVTYFHVPTPLTELFFKTVMRQGQYTDAFFTSNISKRFNFSIAFKGLRSLGNYQNILSGLKQFRFTTNYSSENNRYYLRSHIVSQSFENQENGGLTEESIENFELEDPLFNERSKLSVKFENATNLFSSKRYFIDQDFIINKNVTSSKKNTISIGHRFQYETLKNTYSQDSPTNFYGTINSALSRIDDKAEIKTTLNELYSYLNSNFFGKIKVIYTNYNYNYKSNSLSADFKSLSQNESALTFKFYKSFFNHDLNATITKNLFGDRLGNLIDLSVSSSNKNKINYSLGINILNKHPGFYYELYSSGYLDVNWNNEIQRTQYSNIFFDFKSQNFGNIRLDFRTIDNFTYFYLSGDDDISMTPQVAQNKSTMDYLRIRWNKEFKFGKFALNNTILYQTVDQDENILNLPNFISRNSIYYSNTVLKGALFFQSGFTFKYFSKYYADEYNPLISSFHVQSKKQIGGFPIIDFFINAKIQQTRLFLKAEHFNSTFSGNNFYSSPGYPYRDFTIRFGLVWNFFN